MRALRQLPYTGLLEITIVARRPVTLSAASVPEAPPELMGMIAVHTTPDIRSAPRQTLQILAASGRDRSGVLSIAAAQGFIFDEGLDRAPVVAPAADSYYPKVVPVGTMLTFTKALAAGASYHFALVGSTLTSAHVGDPLGEAQRLTAEAMVRGTANLVAEHVRAWEELWTSDILIEGDEQTQRDVHSMLYHLYSSIREGTGYSIAPMGLSRGPDGYLGHIFWDADTWMLPALLVLHPPLAKSMLDYRYERLPAARRRAAARGYRGAMFPWESAATGDEDQWSSTLGLEQHITADVALAAWNYYRVTQDRDWLRERGYPLLKATADFWASRVTRNGPGRYDIAQVTGADERFPVVDNSAYTNAAARENLAAATAAARVLGERPDPDWEQVRNNIPILHFPDGVTRGHALQRQEDTIKSEVNFLAYPLEAITDPNAIRRDLEYNERRTDNFPPFAKAAFAVLYARLGQPEKAYRVFKAAYARNERPPFAVIAEYPASENPYLATAAGGLLQSILFGFGALHITNDGLDQETSQLPSAWKSLTLTHIGPQGRRFVVRHGP
jgi:trehalose/maltose hydrolase-like predicted phosphorylase